MTASTHISRRCSKQLRRLTSMFAVAAVFAGASALLPAPASAANQVSGCFAYRGTAVRGLSTNLEYLAVDNTWRWLGAVGATDGNGCVTYTIWSPAWRTYLIRIRATGVVPAWRAMVSGSTPFYAGGDSRTYRLGVGGLVLFPLPSAAPDPPEQPYAGLTTTWLDEMNGTGNGGGCNGNAALLVACYMDIHGLHGNVIVLNRDDDGDGYVNDRDRYPHDPNRS